MKLRNLFEKLTAWLSKKSRRSIRRTVLSAFAIVIALCTVYALILPGITATANVYPLDEEENITGVKLQIMPSGSSKWQTVGATTETLTVGLNDKLQFQMNYSLESGTLSNICDTISYQLPVVFSSVTVVDGAPVIDNGAVIGTYSITQDGLVTITFNSNMVSKNATVPIVGTFMFNCKVSDVIGNTGSQTITIGEWSIDLNTGGGGGGGDETSQHETEPTEPPPPQNQDMKVSKTHNVIDSANGVVDCTVLIQADKATDTAPLIYDWMPTGFTYLQGFEIHEVTLNTDGTIKTVGNTVAGSTTVDNEETLVVGKRDFYFQCADPMAKDAVYAITYRGKVIDPFSGSYHTNNQVKVKTKIEGDNVESGYKDDIWLYNDNFVTKKGTFKVDGNGKGYIEWTITVHRTANSVLDGWVLSDVLEGYDYTGEAELKIGNGSPTTITFPYTFPAGSSGSSPESYVFTYSTPYAPKIGETGVANSVVYRPGDYTGDNPIVITETVGMDENNPLEKTTTELTIDTTDSSHPLAIVDWNVDITPTVSDILGTDGYDWLYDDTLHDGQYMTPTQAAALESAIVAEMTTKRGLERGTPPENENAAYNPAVQKQYTFELKRSDSAALPSGCYDRFTLHVYVDLEKDDQINFDYSSTGPSGDLDQEHTYENRGKVMQNAPGNHVYTVESWVSAKYRPALLKTDPIPPTKTNKASNNPLTTHEYYEVDGMLEWDLAVCIPEGIETAVTVEDVLPEGVTFDSVIMRVNGKTNPTYTVAWDDASAKETGTMTISNHGFVDVTRDGQALTLVVDPDVVAYYGGGTDVLNFRVKAKLDQIPSYEDEDDAPRFSNEAAVKVPTGTPGEMKTLGEDEQAQRITVDKYHGVLSKTVEQSATDKLTGRIPYHIEINPDALDLLEGTDTLILTDKLSAYCQDPDDVSVSLNPSSLHLYYRDETKQGNRGEPLDMSQYSYSYSSDYIDHHIVDDLVIHIPDETALVIEYDYIIHTLNSFNSNISNSVKLEGITDGEVTSGNTIMVDFTSSGAIAGLDGITLYKVDSKNYGMTLPDAQFTLYKYNGTAYVVDRVVTTNENGVSQLTNLDEGVAYQLVETLAPENYVRDPDPYYFMIAGATETVAPSDFRGDLLQQGVAVYRPNISNYAEVNVVKQWQDVNGSEVSHDGTVLFNLYRKIGTRDPHVTLTATITRKDSQYATPITIPFEPQQFNRGDTVEFVVTETRYRPAQNRPQNVTFYVNGDPRVVEPYWDPSQNYNDNAVVTYTITFRMDDDTNVVADLGIIDAARPATISAHLSGTTLPPQESTGGPTTPTQSGYAIHFTAGGSGTVDGSPISSGQNLDAGTQVTLIEPTLSEIPAGKRFVGWKIEQRANHNDVTANYLSGNVVTMPSFKINVVAQYEDIPAVMYDVYFVNGETEGSPIVTKIGSAPEGDKATITASAPETGMEFDTWTVVNSAGEPIVNPDVTFTDPHNVTTDFTMPAHDVYVRPSYKVKTAYSITVSAADGGAASYHVDTDAATGYAFKGDTVTLSVDTIPNGKLFDKWVIVSAPDGFTLTNPKDQNPSFTMPAGDVSVRATFRNKPNNLIMNGDFENVEGPITSSTAGFEWTASAGDTQFGTSWSVVDGVLVYDPTDASSNSHLLAKIDPTYNNGNGLKANTEYTLFADVSTDNPTQFNVGVKVGSNTPYTITTEGGYIHFTTGDDPSIYSILVKMQKNGRTIPAPGVSFSVDNVILVEGTVTEPPSGETTYNVNLTQTDGGVITSSKGKAAENAEITLTATPDSGYHFVSWTVTEATSGDPVTVTGNKITMPADAVNVQATFAKNDYNVTVVDGTASPTTIQIGGTVTLDLDESKIPANKVFDHWEISGDGGGTFTNTGMGHDPNAVFLLNTPGDVTLTAVYDDVKYNITFDPEGSGTAVVNDSNVTRAKAGAAVTLVPGTAPTGKVFDYWSVAETASGNTVTLLDATSFTMPAAPVTVTAHYKDAPVSEGYTLTLDATCTGAGHSKTPSVDPSSSTMVFGNGDTATVTVTLPGVWQGSQKTASEMAGMFTYSTDNGTVVTPSFEHGTGNDIVGIFTLTMTKDETIHICANHPDDKVSTFEISGGTGGGETSTPESSTPETSTTETSTPEVSNDWENSVNRITLTFNDEDCTQYGILYHSYHALSSPVIQYVQGANATAEQLAAGNTVNASLAGTLSGGSMMSNYNPTTFEFGGNKVGVTDYSYKGTLPVLDSGTTYTYRVGGTLNGEEVWSDPITFTTRGATTADPNMSFIWFSDSHYNTLSNSGTALRKVLDAADSLLPNGPDMILSGGDFTDQGEFLYYASSALDGNKDYFASTPFFVASGNHDRKGVASTASYIVNVDLSNGRGAQTGTGDYYSFNYNGVHVVVLDNGDENHSNVSTTMVNWLEQDLAANAANPDTSWTIVMMHKPIYGPVQSGASESVPQARGQLAEKFAQYGVDVVMQGHVHMYARSKPITDAAGTISTTYTTSTESANGFTYNVVENPGAPIYTVMGIAGATGYRTTAGSQPAYLETSASGQPYSFSAWRIVDDKLYVDAGYANGTNGSIAGYYEHFVIDKGSGGGGGDSTTYAVNITTPTHGSVTTNKATAAANQSVTLTVTPDSGYELDTLTVDGANVTASVSGGTYTFTMPAHAVAVSATFKETGGSGGDDADNLIVNGDFSQGTTGWTNGGTSFTVSGGVASFQNGQNASDKNGLYQLVNFISGHSYTLTCDITLAEGSSPVKLSLDGTSTPKTDLTGHYSYTFTATNSMDRVCFTGDKRKFTIDNIVLIDNDAGGGGGDEPTTYTVSAATGLTGGSIASVSPVTAEAGDTITVTLSPNTGYELDAWNITGGITPTATGNTNEYTFEMPANNVTVSASFKETGGGGGDDVDNLIVNGDFSTGDFTGWTKGGTVTISNGQCDIFQSNAKLQQTIAVTSGKTYTLSFDVVSAGGKAAYGEVMQGGSTTATKVINQVVSSYPTRVSGQFTATADSVTIQIRPASGGSASLVVDNVSLVELPSLSASPMEMNGPGDDGPVLDMDGAGGNLLGADGGVLVDTYTITASNSWELLIENLVSTEIVNGQEVFYVYYVEEVMPVSDDFVRVAYDNNDGITAGDITIINTVSETEQETIILPETGGGGNLPFVIGGTTLIALCLFGGVVMTRRRRNASG